MGLPLAYLETLLKNDFEKLSEIQKNLKKEDENTIPVDTININGEDVSINQLVDFWIEQHQMLDKAKKILKEQPSENKQTSKVCRETKTRSTVSSKKTNKVELSTSKGKTK